MESIYNKVLKHNVLSKNHIIDEDDPKDDYIKNYGNYIKDSITNYYSKYLENKQGYKVYNKYVDPR